MVKNKTTPALSAKNVTVKFGNLLVLDSVSFEIQEKEYVGIIGPNGAGKSTLLKAILGIIQHEGKIQIFGKSPEKSRNTIGYVPQMTNFSASHFPISVEEMICSGLAGQNFFTPLFWNTSRIIAETLGQVGLTGFEKKDFRSLSGGQKQRVLIARALIHSPKILLLDEPLSGVDANAQESFYTLLENFRSEKNMTIVLISHDLDEVAKRTDRILCLNCQMHCHCHPIEFMAENGKKEKTVHHHH